MCEMMIMTKTQINKLRITYNNAIRRLFNLHPRCSVSVCLHTAICHVWMNLAVFHVIYEYANILYLEAVVPIFICITKM